MDIERSARRSNAVNLTPLIDVVFLLIVFFMLSTSFVVSESMELSLPSQGGASEVAKDVWVLRVLADGDIRDGSDALPLNKLRTRAAEKLKDTPDQNILLLAGDGTSVQQLVSVLDVIYLAGGRQVQMDKDAGGRVNGL